MTGALRTYLGAQLVTTAGSSVTAVVLPVLVFQLTGLVPATSLLTSG